MIEIALVFVVSIIAGAAIYGIAEALFTDKDDDSIKCLSND